MATPDAGPLYTAHGQRWISTAASLTVGAAFLALWYWLLPGWLGFSVDTSGVARWRWVAVIPAVLGFSIALRCIWDFGWTGRGTPAPMVPPSKLVVVGVYRYVRNPMYLGFFLGWLGLWVIFGRASAGAIEVAVGGALAVACFVMVYEEPTLRRKFGHEYEEYCRQVPRWIPRLTPFDPSKAGM